MSEFPDWQHAWLVHYRITLSIIVHCLLQPILDPFSLLYVSALLLTKSIFVCAYLTMAVLSNNRVTLIHLPHQSGFAQGHRNSQKEIWRDSFQGLDHISTRLVQYVWNCQIVKRGQTDSSKWAEAAICWWTSSVQGPQSCWAASQLAARVPGHLRVDFYLLLCLGHFWHVLLSLLLR